MRASVIVGLVCALGSVGCPDRPPDDPTVETTGPGPVPSAGPVTPPPPPDAPPQHPFNTPGGKLALPQPIQFDAGSATLKPESEPILDFVKAFLDAKSDVSMARIEGHTDNQMPPDDARTLTGQRALAVAKALVQRGVDCHRLIPVAFGSDKPTEPNDTPEGRAANRRIEVVVAALRGHAIGGMPVDGFGQVAGNPCE